MRRTIQAAQRVHQRRLAGTGRADQSDVLAEFNVQCDGAQGMHLDLTKIVNPPHITQLDQGHRRYSYLSASIGSNRLARRAG